MSGFTTFGFRREGSATGGNHECGVWSSSFPVPAGRWKCPDCGAWVANWIAVHRCHREKPFGGKP